jgi:hypothetical protein
MDATLAASTPLAGTADAAPKPPAPVPTQPEPAVEPAAAVAAAPTTPLPTTPPAAPEPGGPSADETAAGDDHPAGAPRRSVVDLADRLDDSRFFSSLFDFTFVNYVTRKLAGPVYVVGLVLIGLGIVVGFAQSLAIAVSTQSPAGAFAFLLGVLVTVVAAILAVLLLRVGIEVFVAIIEIAQNTRGRRRPPRD